MTVFDWSERVFVNYSRYYCPKVVVGLFSGGCDSLVSTHVAAKLCEKYGYDFVVGFIDTTIGLPETFEFVRKVCERYGWKFEILKSGYDYTELVKRWGFPGLNYRWCMVWLKLKALYNYTKKVRRPLFISGVRKDESRRRLRLADEGKIKVFMKDHGAGFLNLILNWSEADVWDYIVNNDLPINPVSEKLHFSGDCFCGAFSSKGEIMKLKEYFPHMFERLCKIEEDVNKIRRRREPLRWGLYNYKGIRYWKKQESLKQFICSCPEGK